MHNARMPTVIDPRSELERFRLRFKTQREAADALSISEPFLSDMLKGNRAVSERILNQLNLRRAVIRETRTGGK